RKVGRGESALDRIPRLNDLRAKLCGDEEPCGGEQMSTSHGQSGKESSQGRSKVIPSAARDLLLCHAVPNSRSLVAWLLGMTRSFRPSLDLDASDNVRRAAPTAEVLAPSAIALHLLSGSEPNGDGP